MALNVTGNIQLNNGITLSSVYGRTLYRVNPQSTEVSVVVDYWVDKASYDNNLSTLSLAFQIPVRYQYDRTVDGADVLDFTNQKIKTELESLGYSVVITDI